MKNLLQKTQRGFTIIELIIVLAIAGLILVIVLVAVPQLQRNTRDNARKGIVNRIKGEMDNYSSNNQSTYPFNTAACGGSDLGKWCDFFNRYVKSGSNYLIDVKDPSGSDVVNASPSGTASSSGFYLRSYQNGITLPAQAGAFAVIYGAKCAGESVTASGSTSIDTKNYAVVIGLDRDNTRYCTDNG